jgi:hypothetical protein
MKNLTRRKVLKGAMYGGPIVWFTPIITSVMLPLRAQVTPARYAVGEAGPCGGLIF